MSAMSPGPTGFQPRSDRVHSLLAGQSTLAKRANQPKCSAASSGDCETTGTFSPLAGFRRGIKLCMDLGYDDDQIRKMVSTNAARALGIEADVAAAGNGERSDATKN